MSANNELQESKADIADIFEEIADTVMDDITGITALDSIPQLKIISTVAKGIVGVRSQYQLYMIKQFLDTVNSGVATPGDINIHLEKLRSDKRQFQKEVNYILVKINSWTDIEKSKYFGNIYITYISGKIDWDKLTLYTDILSQITLYDIEKLKEIYEIYKYTENSNPPFASMLRLQSLGLVVFHDGYVRQTAKNTISGEVKKERGHITDEGKVFYKIITEHKIF